MPPAKKKPAATASKNLPPWLMKKGTPGKTAPAKTAVKAAAKKPKAK